MKIFNFIASQSILEVNFFLELFFRKLILINIFSQFFKVSVTQVEFEIRCIYRRQMMNINFRCNIKETFGHFGDYDDSMVATQQ